MPPFNPIQRKLPKTRITLTYRTVIEGKEKEVDLPFRFLVLGELSQRAGKRDLTGQPSYGLSLDNFDLVMRTLNPNGLTFTVAGNTGAPAPTHKNKPEDAVGGPLALEKQGFAVDKLPVNEWKALQPAAVVKNVPFLRDLLYLKEDLLASALNDINNSADLYNALNAVYKDPATLTAAVGALNGTAYALYRDPAANPAPLTNLKKAQAKLKLAQAQQAAVAAKAAAPDGAEKTAFATALDALLQAPADAAKKAAYDTARTALVAKDANSEAYAKAGDALITVTAEATALSVTLAMPADAAAAGNAVTTAQAELTTAQTALSTINLGDPASNPLKPLLQAALGNSTTTTAQWIPLFQDSPAAPRDGKWADADLALAKIAALLLYVPREPNTKTYFLSKKRVMDAIEHVTETLSWRLSQVLHAPTFKGFEATWQSLRWMVSNIDLTRNMTIDVFDASKDEIADDFSRHTSNIFNGFNGALHKLIYTQEFDQYGGRPFGVMIGLYEFDSRSDDMNWLTSMANLANASHAPFLAAASPSFFIPSKDGAPATKADQVVNLVDLEKTLSGPQFNDYHVLRKNAAAAYLGLTFPRFILRLPYDDTNHPATNLKFFNEDMYDDTGKVRDGDRYLWGNAAVLMACQLGASFAQTSWCQYICGHYGGGLIEDLPTDEYVLRGQEDSGQKELMIPVEAVIPDSTELAISNVGITPLVYRKYTSDATFFSAPALKDIPDFEDPKDTENAQLVANIAYTFSVTRIAHYFKMIMRHQVGSSADASTVLRTLSMWLNDYVTTVTNPDDQTLRRYPFKAAAVTVTPVEGRIGWFDCKAAILPHIQLQGVDIELRLEARLAAGKN